MDGRRIACDRCGAEVGAEERHAEIEYVYGDGGGGMTLCRDCFKLVMDTVHGQEAKRQGDAESPTMDERRAVARRLRGYDCPVLPSQQTTMEAVDAVVECMGLEDDEEMCTVRHFLDRLAELIDPGEDVSVSAYDMLPEEDREALRWVRGHGGLDEIRRQRRDSVPRVAYECNLAKRQRQVDESHAALMRRNRWIAELEHLLCKEMSYSLRRDAGCLAPEALDADGVEIRVGDRLYDTETGCGRTVRAVNDNGTVEFDGHENRGWFGKFFTHRAPVLAADGLPLREGEHVYHVETGAELVVKELPKSGAYQAVVVFAPPASHLMMSFDPDRLTHQHPVADSWERMEEDAGKEACEYFAHMPCGCETSEMLDETMEKCNAAKARDLVRRARALAGRGL